MVQSAPEAVKSLMAVVTRRWTVAVLWSEAAGEIPVRNVHWKTQVF